MLTVLTQKAAFGVRRPLRSRFIGAPASTIFRHKETNLHWLLDALRRPPADAPRKPVAHASTVPENALSCPPLRRCRHYALIRILIRIFGATKEGG